MIMRTCIGIDCIAIGVLVTSFGLFVLIFEKLSAIIHQACEKISQAFPRFFCLR